MLANEENDLTPMMRRTLARLFDDLVELENRIAEVTREIEALASRDDRARRLMTVPGIGPLVATAFVASAGDGSQFRRAKIWPPGLDWFPENIRLEARQHCWASAREVIITCGAF